MRRTPALLSLALLLSPMIAPAVIAVAGAVARGVGARAITGGGAARMAGGGAKAAAKGVGASPMQARAVDYGTRGAVQYGRSRMERRRAEQRGPAQG